MLPSFLPPDHLWPSIRFRLVPLEPHHSDRITRNSGRDGSKRLLWRPSLAMECGGDRLQALRGDPEQSQGRAIWCSSPLLPVTEWRDTHADRKSELGL